MSDKRAWDLDGKVAVVTGAGGRLGKAAAIALAEHGADVLSVDIDSERAEQTADHIQKLGHKAEAIRIDVSLDDEVQRMVSTAVSALGGLDVLFNNAGVIGLEHGVSLLDLSPDLWDHVFAVNLRSVMLGCKHAIPAMQNRGGGSLINMSSDSSLGGDLENFAYASSKGAINVLTKYVATTYGKDNIRCNAVAPGIHLDKAYLDSLTPERRAYYARFEDHVLLNRLGTPEDIADTVVFLASDASRYITGQLIQIDGGLMGHAPHFADVRRNQTSSP